VILTATDDQREIQRYCDLGCNVYITKPADSENFAHSIRQFALFFSVGTPNQMKAPVRLLSRGWSWPLSLQCKGLNDARLCRRRVQNDDADEGVQASPHLPALVRTGPLFLGLWTGRLLRQPSRPAPLKTIENVAG
jgi:hypothetical protein